MQAFPLSSDVAGCSKSFMEINVDEHSSGQELLQGHVAKVVNTLSEYSQWITQAESFFGMLLLPFTSMLNSDRIS